MASCNFVYHNGMWATAARRANVSSPAAAFSAYEAGAKLGDAPAQFRLGGCYVEGKGVKPDPAAAVFWYKCAGAAGNRDAIRELGIAFLRGKGVDKNPAEGRRLLDAAARAGDREAAKILEEL